MKSLLRSRTLKIALAVVLCAVLAWSADWRKVAETLIELDGYWFAVSLLLFVPQTVVSAVRWRWWIAPLCRISFRESAREILAASALNIVMPGKLGDISRAAMLPGLTTTLRTKAGGQAAVEKLFDLGALTALLLCGTWGASSFSFVMAIALLGAIGLVEASRVRHRREKRFDFVILGASAWLLWCLHLAQIYCFMRAVGVVLPWHEVFARVPIAIFVGLLPLSFCGIGTRDSALVWLFADLAPAPAMTVVGLLTALRYLVPGAVGIPAFLSYFPSQRRKKSPAMSVIIEDQEFQLVPLGELSRGKGQGKDKARPVVYALIETKPPTDLSR